jgi:hypothetical protein
MTGTYYLGPMGRLMAVDVPIEGFDNPMNELGVLHTGLNGRQTKDVFGYKRSYSIPLDGLTPAAWSWFEMLYRSAVTGPYFLLDPRRRNRLGAAVSTTLSTVTTATVFTPSSGSAVATASIAPLLPSGAVKAPGPSMSMAWNPTAAGTLLGEVAPGVPVLPGETVCFSCYVFFGTPTLEIVPRTPIGTALAPATGTTVVAGSPARRYVTYTVPSDGSVVSVQPQLRASAAGTYTTLAWQLADGTAPEPWVMGDGVPKVLVDQLPSHAEYLNRYTSGSLTLQEV